MWATAAHVHIERVDGMIQRRTADGATAEGTEPDVHRFWGWRATHPLTSRLLRSSARAVVAELAMSSECDFWSRAMGSGCDVITAIRGGLRTAGGCKSV